MKIPNTDLEQKAWMVCLIMVSVVLISIMFGIQEYGKYLLLAGLVGLGLLCFVAHKKNWIVKEVNE